MRGKPHDLSSAPPQYLVYPVNWHHVMSRKPGASHITNRLCITDFGESYEMRGGRGLCRMRWRLVTGPCMSLTSTIWKRFRRGGSISFLTCLRGCFSSVPRSASRSKRRWITTGLGFPGSLPLLCGDNGRVGVCANGKIAPGTGLCSS